jgi:peptide/nickel transport system permease protein
MIAYMARRVLEAAVTLLAVSAATFVLLHLLPFNIAVAIAGPRASAYQVAQVAAEMGLNLPLPLQFVLWLRQLGASGLQLAAVYAPPSLELLALGCLVAALAASGLAYLQARRPGSFFDRASSLVAYILYTLPSFWVGFVLIFIFAIDLLWLPAAGPNLDPTSQGFGNWVAAMVLPVMTLALTTIATWTIYFRGAIEEALRSDYVRTARAKGLPEESVIITHVLRNAVLPAITIAGMSLPNLFNNVIAIELVYGIQGLGSTFLQALAGFDYGTAVDLVVVIGAVTILGSLIADILLAIADPRIQYG